MRRKMQVILLVMFVVLQIRSGVSAEDQPILISMEATAYCDQGITASGTYTRLGIAAAKKEWIGMTAIVYIDNQVYGIYEIQDTGGDRRIREGKVIDIWMPTYDECIRFGRREVKVQIINADG